MSQLEEGEAGMRVGSCQRMMFDDLWWLQGWLMPF